MLTMYIEYSLVDNLSYSWRYEMVLCGINRSHTLIPSLERLAIPQMDPYSFARPSIGILKIVPAQVVLRLHFRVDAFA